MNRRIIATIACGLGMAAELCAAPSSSDRLASCSGLPAPARIARHDDVGEDAVYVVGRGGDRYLAFPEHEGGCEVYPLAHATRLDGHFGAGTTTALAARALRCGGSECPVAVAIRGKGDVPVLALRTADCAVGLELHALRLFDDRDAIELVCRNSAGAGWTERHLVLDATVDTLVTLYDLAAGFYQAPTPAEKRAGDCGRRLVGWLRVEQAGAHPLVRVLDPSTGTLEDGAGTVPARQLAYDPKKHELVPTTAPAIPTPVDGHVRCKR